MLDNSITQEYKSVQAVELSDAEMEKVSGGGYYRRRYRRRYKRRRYDYWY